MIHNKTAIIDPKNAKLIKMKIVTIGPYCVIGPNVQIADNKLIQSHVNIWKYFNWKKIIKFFPFVFYRK